jgi:hypothetical protein
MKNRDVAFDGCKVSVEYEEYEANDVSDLLNFLFLDLSDVNDAPVIETLSINRNHEKERWELMKDGKSMFKGESLAGLGVILMGEVLFHLIRENSKGLAIHAGLVSDDQSTTLIPGASGSGKSSVTTWMLCNGRRYHTDELVSIDLETQHVRPFTRPLNIKTRGVETIRQLIDLDSIEDKIRVSAGVTMIPHRLVNPDFRNESPKISHVIFPKYIADSKPEVVKLSGAEAGLELMRSNVIARNLPSHGFSDIIKLVRNIPAYKVHYQHFDDLPDLISRVY